MVITEIIGGLGNQLFEYANARALCLKLNQELSFDFDFFKHYHRKDVYRLDKFNTKINIASSESISKVKRKPIKPDIIQWLAIKMGATGFYSNSFHFDESWFETNPIDKLKKLKNFYLSGYFADYKYFTDIESTIRNEFTLKVPLNTENIEMLAQIEAVDSVSIHIRRGDYVNNAYFEELGVSYYEQAAMYIQDKYPNSVYFIFSDDLEWAKENLKFDSKIVFVDVNNQSTDYMELMLMAGCKHNIIANSTFSWWAAWLNQNPSKIVIAPKLWYKNDAQNKIDSGHLVPSTWIKI